PSLPLSLKICSISSMRLWRSARFFIAAFQRSGLNRPLRSILTGPLTHGDQAKKRYSTVRSSDRAFPNKFFLRFPNRSPSFRGGVADSAEVGGVCVSATLCGSALV